MRVMRSVDGSGAGRQMLEWLATAKCILSVACLSIRALKTSITCVVWIGLRPGLKSSAGHLRPPGSVSSR